MDQKIKEYADTLYESARMASGRTQRQERADTAHKRALNNPTVPLSGVDLQIQLNIATRHIDRCMASRLDSYKEAFSQSGETPSEEDLSDIIVECQSVREQEIKHAMGAIRNVINSHGGGVPFLPEPAMLEQSSAHGHDRVLDQWKVWKAKLQLKPALAKTPEQKKQLDAMVQTYTKADFEPDLAALVSKSTAERPCSLLFIDLDNFKSINDTLGHPAGDRVLTSFAGELLRCCDGKGSVYRNGGDEFCVVLPNHSVDEGVAVAERILRNLRAIRTEELPNGITASTGVASFPTSLDDNHTMLLSRADKALYASKKAGRDRVSKATHG